MKNPFYNVFGWIVIGVKYVIVAKKQEGPSFREAIINATGLFRIDSSHDIMR